MEEKSKISRRKKAKKAETFSKESDYDKMKKEVWSEAEAQKKGSDFLKSSQDFNSPKVPAKGRIFSEKIDQDRKPASGWKYFLLSVLVLILFLLAVLFCGIYNFRWRGPMIDKVVSTFSLPAVYINGQPISLETFNNNTEVLQRYLNRSKQKIVSVDLEKMTLDALVESAVVKQLADKNNILATDTEAGFRLEQLLSDPEERLKIENMTVNLYGWDFETFSERVLRPLILKQKLEKYFYEVNGELMIIDQLNGIKELLDKDAAKFEQIAQEINQDDSQETSGDLGWLKLGETAPEFELQLLNLRLGEISPVIQTRYGFHIIRVEEKMVNEKDQPLFHASHIFIKRPSFEDYLQEQIKKSRVVTLIRL